MGFFSWNASNTGKSIANSYSKKRTFTVAMVDDKNNIWIGTYQEGILKYDKKMEN